MSPDANPEPTIEITGVAQKRAWDEGVLPPVENLGQGLWSIPVPMPQSSLRYVLVYALELANGVAIVDAGWDTAEAWEALTSGLTKAGYAIGDVEAVLVTHIHPDHYGLAGRVRAASGAWIALHPADADVLQGRYVDTEPLIDLVRAQMAAAGVPEAPREAMGQASMPIRNLVDAVLPDVLLEDGDRPELPGWDVTALWTPGHSPGHLCFYDERRKLLLSGDHVLPRITPNISLHPQQRPNPLADFFESLDKIEELAVEEVLPAHEYRFRGLAQRVAALRAHHERRFGEVVAALEAQPGATAWEVTVELTWSRPWEEIPFFMQRAAVGETLAHLVVLETRGTVRRSDSVPERWTLTGAPRP